MLGAAALILISWMASQSQQSLTRSHKRRAARGPRLGSDSTGRGGRNRIRAALQGADGVGSSVVATPGPATSLVAPTPRSASASPPASFVSYARRRRKSATALGSPPRTRSRSARAPLVTLSTRGAPTPLGPYFTQGAPASPQSQSLVGPLVNLPPSIQSAPDPLVPSTPSAPAPSPQNQSASDHVLAPSVQSAPAPLVLSSTQSASAPFPPSQASADPLVPATSTRSAAAPLVPPSTQSTPAPSLRSQRATAPLVLPSTQRSSALARPDFSHNSTDSLDRPSTQTTSRPAPLVTSSGRNRRALSPRGPTSSQIPPAASFLAPSSIQSSSLPTPVIPLSTHSKSVAAPLVPPSTHNQTAPVPLAPSSHRRNSQSALGTPTSTQGPLIPSSSKKIGALALPAPTSTQSISASLVPSTQPRSVHVVTPSTQSTRASLVPSTQTRNVTVVTSSTQSTRASLVLPSTQTRSVSVHVVTPSTQSTRASLIPSTQIRSVPAVTPSTQIRSVPVVSPSTQNTCASMVPSTQTRSVPAVTPPTQSTRASQVPSTQTRSVPAPVVTSSTQSTRASLVPSTQTRSVFAPVVTPSTQSTFATVVPCSTQTRSAPAVTPLTQSSIASTSIVPTFAQVRSTPAVPRSTKSRSASTPQVPPSTPSSSTSAPLLPPSRPAMASDASTSTSFKEELMCPVCYDSFKDAVTLPCGHNFCRDCVTRSWGYRADQACPICQEVSSLEALRTNHTLNNLVQMLRQEERQRARRGKEALCALHQEETKLFCLDDKDVICAQCQASKQHENHKVRPVAETAKDYRAKWKNMETSLRDKLREFGTVKGTYDSIVKHNESETIRIQDQIKKEFEKLHEFLRNEEKAALADLDEEAMRKQKLVDEKIKKLLEEMGSLSLEINKLQSEMKESDVSFLMKHKNRKRRIACTADEPEAILTGSLIDVAHHLGSLQYRVWKKMLNSIKVVPFNFDPNTAASWLTVSEDLNSVTSQIQRCSPVVDNPRRFSLSSCILGSRSFFTGRHSWEVDVSKATNWHVGVTYQSNRIKTDLPPISKCGYWYIDSMESCRNYTSNSSKAQFILPDNLKRIRVELNCNEGELSFYDEHNSHIYTFHKKFSENVLPYFCVSAFLPGTHPGSLSICPVAVSIREEPIH